MAELKGNSENSLRGQGRLTYGLRLKSSFGSLKLMVMPCLLLYCCGFAIVVVVTPFTVSKKKMNDE